MCGQSSSKTYADARQSQVARDAAATVLNDPVLRAMVRDDTARRAAVDRVAELFVQAVQSSQEAEIARLQGLLMSRSFDLQQTMDGGEVLRLRADVASLEERLRSAQRSNQEERERHQRLLSDLKSDLSRAVEYKTRAKAANERAQMLEVQAAQLQQQVQQLQIAAAQSEKAASVRTDANAELKIQRLTDALEGMRAAVRRRDAKLAKAEALASHAASLEAQLRELQSARRDQQADALQRRTDVETVTAENARLQAEISSLQQTSTTIGAESADLRRALEETQRELNAAKTLLQAAKTRFEKDRAQLTLQRDQAATARDGALREIEGLRATVASLENRLELSERQAASALGQIGDIKSLTEELAKARERAASAQKSVEDTKARLRQVEDKAAEQIAAIERQLTQSFETREAQIQSRLDNVLGQLRDGTLILRQDHETAMQLKLELAAAHARAEREAAVAAAVQAANEKNSQEQLALNQRIADGESKLRDSLTEATRLLAECEQMKHDVTATNQLLLAAQDDVRQKTEELAAEKQRVAAQAQTLEEARATVDSLRNDLAEVQQTLQDTVAGASADQATLTEQVAKLRSDLRSARAEAKSFQKAASDAAQTTHEATIESEKAAREVERLSMALDQANTECAAVRDALQAANDRILELESELCTVKDGVQKTLGDERTRLAAEADTAASMAAEQILALQEEIKRITEELGIRDRELKSAQQALSEQRNVVDSLNQSLREGTEIRQKYEQFLRSTVQSTTSQVKLLRQALQRTRADAEAQRSHMQREVGQVLSVLMARASQMETQYTHATSQYSAQIRSMQAEHAHALEVASAKLERAIQIGKEETAKARQTAITFYHEKIQELRVQCLHIKAAYEREAVVRERELGLYLERIEAGQQITHSVPRCMFLVSDSTILESIILPEEVSSADTHNQLAHDFTRALAIQATGQAVAGLVQGITMAPRGRKLSFGCGMMAEKVIGQAGRMAAWSAAQVFIGRGIRSIIGRDNGIMTYVVSGLSAGAYSAMEGSGSPLLSALAGSAGHFAVEKVVSSAATVAISAKNRIDQHFFKSKVSDGD